MMQRDGAVFDEAKPPASLSEAGDASWAKLRERKSPEPRLWVPRCYRGTRLVRLRSRCTAVAPVERERCSEHRGWLHVFLVPIRKRSEPTSGLEPLPAHYEWTVPTGRFSASLYLTAVVTNVSTGESCGVTNVLTFEILAGEIPIPEALGRL